MITDKDVTIIATSIFNANATAETGKVSYLRALIDATKDELQNKKGEPANNQLAALQRVHERFYALILEAAQPFVPRTQKDRSVTLHARANFARTALSALRNHVRAGEDIVALNSTRATKATLAKPKPKVIPLSVKRWTARAESQSKALVATLIGLADADKAAAVAEMQLVLGQLNSQLMAMGVTATKDATQAIAEHRPLKIGKTLFMPTETQVLRQQARPS